MIAFFKSVNLPQATIISGFLTIVAAIIGVFIGWLLFSGRVKDLKEAIEASENLLTDHELKVKNSLENVHNSISDLAKSVTVLDEQFKVTLESLGQLRGNVSDIQGNIIDTQNQFQNKSENLSEFIEKSRENLRQSWMNIRENLEKIAANTRDGRTRAKYGRIDRRNYLDLIKALQDDGALGSEAGSYKEAAEIWQKYRNGRSSPTDDESKTMSDLKQRLTATAT